MHNRLEMTRKPTGYGPSSVQVPAKPEYMQNDVWTCETFVFYQEMKEQAEERLLASSYGDVAYNLKLKLYVEHRAMREHGYVV